VKPFQSISNISLRDTQHPLRTLQTAPFNEYQSRTDTAGAGYQTTQPKFLSIKDVAALYGMKVGAIYEFIKGEPDFPYVNAGVKKRFMIDVTQFEAWLTERTVKQKHARFSVPTALDLLTAFKTKLPGGVK
jgi:hypothetical protein